MRDSSDVREQWWNRPLLAGILLLAIYVVLSLAMSPGGYLGTDTGAKVATLDVMDERGTPKPVLGYWAEDVEPEGRLHPIYDALPVDGDWVHVTTLPMLELARPLWALGGYRATLLLPMLGAVGAAFAARSLATQSADASVGWQAFWLVGLASPLVVYALDLWEHAPGVACMVGAVALLARVVDGDRAALRSIAAGALLGLSATMRTETFVYSLVIVGGAGLAILLDRRRDGRLGDAVRVGAGTLLGFAGPWFANALLESAVGGNDRGTRVSGTATGGIDRIGDRAQEAIVTLFATRPQEASRALLGGGVAAVLVATALVLDRRGDVRRARVAFAGAVALHLVTLMSGLGFVPGLFSAAPIAVGGLALLPTSRSGRYVLALALASMPLVWAFQYLGGAGPQWAGRYVLTSCTMLVTLGVVHLQRSGRWLRAGLVALTAFVALTGLLWTRERTHDFERLFDDLVERPEDVIVARNGFFIREGGDAYSERLWLTAVSDEDLEQAVRVVRAKGLETLAVLDQSPTAPADIRGAELVATSQTSVVGVRLYLHSYEV